MFFANLSLENSVTKAARQIRTGEAATSGMDESGFKKLICGGGVDMFLGDGCPGLVVDVQVFNTFEGIGSSLPSAIDASGNLNALNGWDPGSPLSVMVVRAFYEWDTLVPPVLSKVGVLANGKLLIAATNTFRNEPYL